MADTQDLIGRGTLPGERPYETRNTDARRMDALTSMGGAKPDQPSPDAGPGAPVPANGPPMKFPRGQFKMPEADATSGPSDPTGGLIGKYFLATGLQRPETQQDAGPQAPSDTFGDRTKRYGSEVLQFAQQQQAMAGNSLANIMNGGFNFENVKNFALGGLGLVGMPFVYVGGMGQIAVVTNTPYMKQRFDQVLSKYGIDPNDWSRVNERMAVADMVLQEFKNGAVKAATDPNNKDLMDRAANGLLSVLLAGPEMAQLAAPSGVLAVRNLGKKILTQSETAASVAASLQAFAKGEGGGAAEIGAKGAAREATSVEDLAARTKPGYAPQGGSQSIRAASTGSGLGQRLEQTAPLPADAQLNAEALSQRTGAPDTAAQQATREELAKGTTDASKQVTTPEAAKQDYVGRRVMYPTSTGTGEGTIVDWTPDGNPIIKTDSGELHTTDHYTTLPEKNDAAPPPPPTVEQQHYTEDPTSVDVKAEFRQLTGLSADMWPDSTVALMARAYKANPKAFEAYRFTGTHAIDYINAAAKTGGMSAHELMDMMREKGFTDGVQMAGFVHQVNLTMDSLSNDVNRLVASGVPQDDPALVQAWSDYHDFAAHVFGMRSTWGHTGRAIQLSAQADFVEANRLAKVVDLRQKALATAKDMVTEAQTNLESAKATGNDVLTKRWEAAMKRRVTAADKAETRYKSAFDAHMDKWNKARELAFRRFNQATMNDRKNMRPDPALKDKIQSLTPGDMGALLKVLRDIPGKETGSLIGSVWASGALTSTAGLMRSGMGAFLNLAQEYIVPQIATVAVQPIRAFGKQPIFEMTEILGRNHGLWQFLKESWPATKQFWVEGMRFEDMYGLPSFNEGVGLDSSIRDIMEAGTIPDKAKALLAFGGTMGGRAHAWFHGLTSLAQYNMEFHSLAMRDATRAVASGKTGDLLGEYKRILEDQPSNLIEMSQRLAQDQSFTHVPIGYLDEGLKWAYNLGGDRFPIGKAMFVANRFMLGSASRGLEYSGGGVLRAIWDTRPDIPGVRSIVGASPMKALINKAIDQRAMVWALRDASEGKISFDPEVIRAKADAYKSDPTVISEARSMDEVSGKVDYVQREAMKAGVKGAMGATFLGWGLEEYNQGHLKRENFQTIYDDGQGHVVNLTGFAPFTLPLTLATVIGDSLKASKAGGLDIEQAVVPAIQAITSTITDISIVTITGDLIDGLRGRNWNSFGKDMALVVERMTEPGFASAALEMDQATDQYVRDPKGFMQYWENHVPIIRRGLRPKINAVGQREQNPGITKTPFEPTPTSPSENDPVIKEDKRLSEALPSDYKTAFDPKNLSQEWSTGEDKIKLSDEQFWSYQLVVGRTRAQMLSALLNTDGYKKADDKTKLKMWRKVDLSARDQARRDMAILLANHGQANNIPKYVKAAFDANGKGRRETALWAMSLAHSGDLSPAVRKSLDDLVVAREKSLNSTLTLKDYLAVAPLLQQYLAIPPFNNGTPDQWAKLENIRSKASQYKRAHPDSEDGSEALTPDEQSLLQSIGESQNSARADFLAEHPELRPYVSGTTYTYVKRG